jgi:hypothetical protein
LYCTFDFVIAVGNKHSCTWRKGFGNKVCPVTKRTADKALIKTDVVGIQHDREVALVQLEYGR